MTPDDPKFNPAKTYMEKLSECVLYNGQCEIALNNGEVRGRIIDVGVDYVCVIQTIEREIFTYIEGEDGKKEKQKSLEIIEVETLLKLSDITGVSKIIKRAVR